MSISELEKLIIPEESDEIKVQISREIPIKISEIQNIDILSNDNDININCIADEIELNFSKTEHKSITIPSSYDLIGTFNVDKDTSLVRKSKRNNLIHYFFGTIKETLRIRKIKKTQEYNGALKESWQ